MGKSKRFEEVAEDAYDRLAADHGVDDYGDETAEVEEVEEEVYAEAEAPDGDEADLDATAESAEEAPEGDEAPEPQAGVEQSFSEPEPIAPMQWPDDLKQAFGKLDATGKRMVFDINRNLTNGYAKKAAKLNRELRRHNGIDQALQPHANRLARAGISPEMAVQRALAWDQLIVEQGPKALAQMAQAYGYDLAQVQEAAGGGKDEYLTPTERAMRRQVEELSNILAETTRAQQAFQGQYQEQQQRAVMEGLAAQVDAFANATTPDGKPLHPYLNELTPTMVTLLEKGAASGLDQAYRMALGDHPEVQSAIARERARGSAQVSRKQAEQVRRASNAGVVTKASGRAKKEMTFGDRLLANYDKVANT